MLIFNTCYAGGLSASQSKLLLLSQRKQSIEYQFKYVKMQRTQLEKSIQKMESTLKTQKNKLTELKKLETHYQNSINSISKNYPLTTTSTKTMDKGISAYQNVAPKLELQLKNIEAEQEAVRKELESVQKIINGSVNDTFKIFQP